MEIYIVKNDDSLYRVARAYGISLQSLLDANQLPESAGLSVGQALVIPQDARQYTVQPGDSLYRIAKKLDIDFPSLLAANRERTDPNRLSVGQVIQLPEARRSILVNAYITNVSDSTLEQTLPYLSFLSPFSYRADVDGGITPTFSVNTALSRQAGVQNLMVLTNLRAEGGFSSDIAHSLFTDSAAQDTLLENVFSVLASEDYSGVNLDFEYVYPYDRQSYNQFLGRLSELLHANGYLLVTALAPKLSDNQQGLLYTAHDYALHGELADYVVLMSYEWGYTYGPAMAVSPLNMVRRVLDYAVGVIPAQKILMGIPNYGYDWTLPYAPGSAATPLTNTRAAARAAEVNAAISFDDTAQSPYYRYLDNVGRRHEVWFEDARSLLAKMKLAERYGLAGVSFWNLNRLFLTNFYALEALFRVTKLRSPE